MAPPTPPVRKPHRFGGLQVRICGKPVQGTVVCTLYPSKHHIHAAIAIGENDEVLALIKKDGEEVEMWQLVGPPE